MSTAIPSFAPAVSLALFGFFGALLSLPRADAAEYQFTVNQNASASSLSSNVSTPLAGTFIGNWDAKTNPEGTMTRPGLFGGSGNMPITYSGTVVGGGNAQTNPTGAYRLIADTSSASAGIADFHLDVLGGANPSFPATFNILYQTFRTFQPNSTFIGGITLPIPLGELVLDSLTITQTGPSQPGALVATGENQYEFTVLIDATVAYSGAFGGSTIGDQFPAALVVTGTLTVNGNFAIATTSFDWSVNETNNGPFPPFVDLPLDVPTVFPSGFIAHLLISGTIQSITTQMSIAANVVGDGQIVKPGDINGDFIVNVNDLLAVINAWGACPAPPQDCSADVAPYPGGDGVVNVNDLLLIINNWG